MRKNILIWSSIIVIMCLTLFAFFYTGYKGTPWGVAAHEKKVFQHLNEHKGDIFTIKKSYYDFRECGAHYITTYYYNEVPDVIFKLQAMDEMDNMWRLIYEDHLGVEHQQTYSNEPMISTPLRTIEEVDDFILFAKVMAGHVEIEELAEEEMFFEIEKLINDTDYTTVPDYETLVESAGFDPIVSAFSSFERLIRYKNGQLTKDDAQHVFQDFAVGYRSKLDMIKLAAEQDIFIVPQSGTKELILERVKQGEPVLYIAGDNQHYIFYGYDEDELLSYNTSQNERKTFDINSIRMDDTIHHPLTAYTVRWTSDTGGFFISEERLRSQLTDGLEVYTLVNNAQTWQEQLEASDLYWKLRAQDALFKKDPAEYALFIEDIEQRNLLDTFAYEYAYYYTFIDPSMTKAAPFILELNEKRNIEVFVFYQELLLAYKLFEEKNEEVGLLLNQIIDHLDRVEKGFYYEEFYNPTFGTMYNKVPVAEHVKEQISADTLYYIAMHLIEEERMFKAREYINLLSKKSAEDKRVGELNQLRDEIMDQ